MNRQAPSTKLEVADGEATIDVAALAIWRSPNLDRHEVVLLPLRDDNLLTTHTLSYEYSLWGLTRITSTRQAISASGKISPSSQSIEQTEESKQIVLPSIHDLIGQSLIIMDVNEASTATEFRMYSVLIQATHWTHTAPGLDGPCQCPRYMDVHISKIPSLSSTRVE